MPSNHSGTWVGYLAGKYPERIGHLFSPEGWRNPFPFIPYALDNGRYVATTADKPWSEGDYFKLLDKAAEAAQAPTWVVVPDVVGSRDDTLREWDRWAPRLEGYGWPLAMAVQDGMTSDDALGVEVIFVGGTTAWKRRTLWSWAADYPRVHVGRINTRKWLWECHEAGVESIDGSGWWHHLQLVTLSGYLERVSAGLGRPDAGLFDA